MSDKDYFFSYIHENQLSIRSEVCNTHFLISVILAILFHRETPFQNLSALNSYNHENKVFSP